MNLEEIKGSLTGCLFDAVEPIPDFAVENFRFWKMPVILHCHFLSPSLFNLHFHFDYFFIGVFDAFVNEWLGLRGLWGPPFHG